MDHMDGMNTEKTCQAEPGPYMSVHAVHRVHTFSDIIELMWNRLILVLGFIRP